MPEPLPLVIFPLKPGDDACDRLRQAAEMIEQVAEQLHTRVLAQTDDPGVSDCEWIGRLDAAAMVVRSCLVEV